MTSLIAFRREFRSPPLGFPATPTGLLLVTLACVSCKPDSPTARQQGVPPSQETSASTPSPATPAHPATAAPSKTSGPARPRPHRQLLALADFSKFPKMPGASRESTSGVYASFSLAKKDDSVVPTSIDAMEKFLASQGWKPSPDGGGAWDAKGGVRFFEKDHARLQAVVGISRGFPSGEDVNAGLFLIGDLDARSLPQPPGSKLESGDPSSARFTSPLDLMSVRKFNKAQLPPLGWVEFRPHTPPGYEVPMEQLEKEQSFVQNGITLSYNLTAKGPATEASVQCKVLENSLPIPPKPDMLELQDSPAVMSCFAEMTLDQAIAWCQEELGKEGWTSSQVPAVEEKTTRYVFKNPAKSMPLILECFPSRKSTFVRLRETRQ